MREVNGHPQLNVNSVIVGRNQSGFVMIQLNTKVDLTT
jgi:hypothetical protein